MRMGGKRIAVLGGDRRMTAAACCFLQAGCEVRVAGLPCDELGESLREFTTSEEATAGAQALLLPVMGVGEDGRVTTQAGVPELHLHVESLKGMAQGAPVFAGVGNRWLRAACAEAGVPLIEYREADEFAIWNSIPSAEGGIQMAMEATPFTIFGSKSLVLGFGRTGKALALLLKGLFSDVTVIVRKETDFARVWASGYRYLGWNGLREAVAESDLIFNTVPSLVLTREILQAATGHTAVIDLASAPGGTDFDAARDLGIKAELAPGLPGIVAPVTAGKIIADLILRHLAIH